MALAISSSAPNKPGMLKDYLLDDLGSCSSSGFRSSPRRQCCVAVRNLIDLELHSRRRSSSKISCAIRKASMAIVSAVKLLPFKSPRSISRGIGKRRLLKKELPSDERSRDYEIEWWISNAAAAVVKHQPLDLTSNETTEGTTSGTNGDSGSESDSEFTLTCSSFDENGVVQGKGGSSAEIKRRGCVRVTVGDESTEAATTKNNWSEEENENLSPVSVLNFRDDSEETGSSSPFTRRLNHLEGTKEKLMQKLRRFECLSQIDPLNIESRPSLTAYSDDETPLLSIQSSPSPQHIALFEDDDDDETEDMAAERLLNLINTKTIIVSKNEYKFNTESLLVNFFLEGLIKGREKNRELVEEMLFKEGEDWLTGICHKEKRKAYVKDVEERGAWRSNGVDKEETVVQVEAQVFTSLVDELVEELIGL